MTSGLTFRMINLKKDIRFNPQYVLSLLHGAVPGIKPQEELPGLLSQRRSNALGTVQMTGVKTQSTP